MLAKLTSGDAYLAAPGSRTLRIANMTVMGPIRVVEALVLSEIGGSRSLIRLIH
jgi:hypothetical protein